MYFLRQEVHLPFCWCSFCFVSAPFALLVLLLLCWCSFCFVSAPFALLVHLRQVHPLKGTP